MSDNDIKHCACCAYPLTAKEKQALEEHVPDSTFTVKQLLESVAKIRDGREREKRKQKKGVAQYSG